MPKKEKVGTKSSFEQIKELFQKAETAFKKSPEEADRLVRKARNLAMSRRLKLPKELKRRFCKHCYAFFFPGKTVRIRTRQGKVIYYCFACKKFTRIPVR